MKNSTRILLVILGTLCVLLALVGMFFPILPTTPFLLLAAFLYARSSERFYGWLVNNRWSGEYIRNYREGKGVRLWHKVLALSLLWGTIGYSVLFVVEWWWLRVILLGIAVGVSVHLLKMKIYRPE